MTKVTIKSASFNGRDGQPVEYERVLIASDVNKELKIELRLSETELTLVKAILATDKK